ncbi:hypothetical protein GVAV_001124 [Gurleya vavrai]
MNLAFVYCIIFVIKAALLPNQSTLIYKKTKDNLNAFKNDYDILINKICAKNFLKKDSFNNGECKLDSVDEKIQKAKNDLNKFCDLFTNTKICSFFCKTLYVSDALNFINAVLDETFDKDEHLIEKSKKFFDDLHDEILNFMLNIMNMIFKKDDTRQINCNYQIKCDFDYKTYNRNYFRQFTYKAYQICLKFFSPIYNFDERDADKKIYPYPSLRIYEIYRQKYSINIDIIREDNNIFK